MFVVVVVSKHLEISVIFWYVLEVKLKSLFLSFRSYKWDKYNVC